MLTLLRVMKNISITISKLFIIQERVFLDNQTFSSLFSMKNFGMTILKIFCKIECKFASFF